MADLLSLAEIVLEQKSIHIIAGLDGLLPLLLAPGVQSPLQRPSHALERCCCNHSCECMPICISEGTAAADLRIGKCNSRLPDRAHSSLQSMHGPIFIPGVPMVPNVPQDCVLSAVQEPHKFGRAH